MEFLTSSQVSAISTVSVISTISTRIYKALTSEQAKHIYRTVFMAVVLTLVALVLLTIDLAKYIWSKRQQSANAVVTVYRRIKPKAIGFGIASYIFVTVNYQRFKRWLLATLDGLELGLIRV